MLSMKDFKIEKKKENNSDDRCDRFILSDTSQRLKTPINSTELLVALQPSTERTSTTKHPIIIRQTSTASRELIAPRKFTTQQQLNTDRTSAVLKQRSCPVAPLLLKINVPIKKESSSLSFASSVQWVGRKIDQKNTCIRLRAAKRTSIDEKKESRSEFHWFPSQMDFCVISKSH